jgi:hypothetical protein
MILLAACCLLLAICHLGIWLDTRSGCALLSFTVALTGLYDVPAISNRRQALSFVTNVTVTPGANVT